MRRVVKSLVLAGMLTAGVAMSASSNKGSAAVADPASVPSRTAANSADANVSSTSFETAIDRVCASEAEFNKRIREFSPMIETYIQNLKQDKDLGPVPEGDEYFLGRLDFGGSVGERSLTKQEGVAGRMLKKLTSLYSLEFVPEGFAQMVLIDSRGLSRNEYDFKYVRREFLGEVRTLVIDVTPKPRSGAGRFLGRIWVEDEGYNIVRYNGTFAPERRFGQYLHFDSWRMNLQPGLWLPAYVYSEESNKSVRFSKMHFKSQTRLWGYQKRESNGQEEYTAMMVEAGSGVDDRSNTRADATPLQATRQWERQAEDNVISRLERGSLLAPEGDVDKILETVVTNLEITNNLEIQPGIRTRVLLTSPLEAFTIGHTIVISRGMLDVLPDETSLAAVMAQQLAHIVLGHKLDTKYAFGDRMLFPDEATFKNFGFARGSREQIEADNLALSLLRNSPYKDKLPSAGLFLKSLQDRAARLPNLLRANLGSKMADGRDIRLAQLTDHVPNLAPQDVKQIASLPLGGRIKVDPWSDRVEMTTAKPTPILSAREKIPFEVTPFFPYLTRYGAGEKAAEVSSGSETIQ